MSFILAIKTSFNPKFRYFYGISLYFPNFLYISTAILGKESTLWRLPYMSGNMRERLWVSEYLCKFARGYIIT